MSKLKLLLILLLFSACSNEEKEENINVDTPSDKEEFLLTKEESIELMKKDSIIEAFSEAYIEIQDNLDQIKYQEKILTNKSKDVEFSTSAKEKIIKDLRLIAQLMQKNKVRIAQLSKQLKETNLKDEKLRKLIERLSEEVTQKDAQIAQLKKDLAITNNTLNQIFDDYQATVEKVFEATEKINTAFYAFGTTKELIKNNVITKEGGFIGIGKNKKIKDNFNKEYFTKINIKDERTIPLACKKAKIITNHPTTSYKFKGDKNIEALEITNEEEFWASSKYLVIVVE
jgi:hypothetical protein